MKASALYTVVSPLTTILILVAFTSTSGSTWSVLLKRMSLGNMAPSRLLRSRKSTNPSSYPLRTALTIYRSTFRTERLYRPTNRPASLGSAWVVSMGTLSAVIKMTLTLSSPMPVRLSMTFPCTMWSVSLAIPTDGQSKTVIKMMKHLASMQKSEILNTSHISSSPRSDGLNSNIFITSNYLP